MIPPGFLSLRATFTRFATAEGEVHGKGPNTGHDAAAKLLYYLAAGQLPSFRVDLKGQEPAAISKEHWPDEEESFNRDIMRVNSFPDVIVKSSDIELLLSSTRADPITKKRGRKPKYDTSNTWAVIAFTVGEHGFEKSQEKMIDAVQKEHENLFGPETAPGRTTLQPMIQELYELRTEKELKIKRDAKAGK